MNVGEVLQDVPKDNLAFHPGQGCGHAEVDAVEEGEVLVVRPVELELVWVGEASRVAVGGGGGREDHRLGGQLVVPQCCLLAGFTEHEV